MLLLLFVDLIFVLYSVVFMVQKLKSMGVLNHPSPYQLYMPEKVVEKVIMDGASTRDSCDASIQNIETTPPQLDNIQSLSSMVDEIP